MDMTKCLAFDSCAYGDKMLCFLYYRRSPEMKGSALFPLLKEERAHSAEYKAELRYCNFCNHYFFREDYFEVRLSVLQAMEKLEQQGGQTKNEITELKEKIISDEEKHSNETLESLVDDAKQLAKEHQGQGGHEQRGPSRNQLIHLSWLLFGLLVGSLGIIFRHRISNGVSELRQISRKKTMHANEGFNDLVLTENNV